MNHQFYAYRSYGDRAGAVERTMDTDPNTGNVPNLHSAGDVIVFDSEARRDAYVAQHVVITHLGGGRDRRFHWVSAITAEDAEEFMEACAAPGMCIHRGLTAQGRVRIPE